MSEEHCFCCTRVVTGTVLHFQDVFVCRTCSPDESQLLCVCQGCADACHADHDGLAYLGTGRSYCDCHELTKCCSLYDKSCQLADDLGIEAPIDDHLPLPSNDGDYIRDRFQLSWDRDQWREVRDEAIRLVGETKETFWVDQATIAHSPSLLESLAWQIYTSHVTRYDIKSARGCEWWIQVKHLRGDSSDDSNQAIDLHYDKDEVISKRFGLGIFPILSTVTYVSDTPNAAPTIILPHRYEDSLNADITDTLICFPELGKHLVFDGRLLHGAPAHRGLRRKDTPMVGDTRVTFLVNIWSHRPAGLGRLPEFDGPKTNHQASEGPTPLQLHPLQAPGIVDFRSADANGLTDAKRSITLPFLGQGTTWETGDDGYLALVSSSWPEDSLELDTLIVFEIGGARLLDSSELTV